MIATMSNLSALVKKLQEHGITLVGPGKPSLVQKITARPGGVTSTYVVLAKAFLLTS